MHMKKYIVLFLSLVCLFTLCSCGKTAAPIVLPEPEKIVSIDVTNGKTTKTYTDSTWIQEIISAISDSEPTSKQSVQDTPQNKSYIKIDFQFEAGASTLFVYEDSGKYYVEQPYQGIYIISSDLFEKIKEAP